MNPWCRWSGAVINDVGEAKVSGSYIVPDLPQRILAGIVIAAMRASLDVLQGEFIWLPLSFFKVESGQLEPGQTSQWVENGGFCSSRRVWRIRRRPQ